MFLIILLLTGTFSCQQKKRVELLPNKEKEYTIIKSNPWEKKNEDVFSFDFKQIKKWSNAFKEVQKRVKTNNASEEFEYALYVNEKGRIDKVKPVKSSYPDMDKFLAEEMSDWQMVTHFENNKPHKYRLDLNFTIWKNKKGIMNVINSNFPIIDNYNGEEFITKTDKMPEPIGGLKSIQEKIHYPEIAKRAGIEGRVFIKAFVDNEGNVAAAQVIKGIGSGCDESALEAAKRTKFIPASWKGKIVGAQVVIPILFKLEPSERKSNSKIVGEWEGKADDGEIIKITFSNNGTTDIYQSKSGRMNGKVTGAKFWPKFEINYEKNPNTLDLIYDSESISKCIVKFVSNNEIIIGFSKYLDERPKNFNSNNISRTWKLKRVK